MFYQRGWSVGTSSNYSVVIQRHPLQMLITASGKDKGWLRTEDILRIDARGGLLEPGTARPSAETWLHVVLAGQPDVGAVLHTHSVWGTLLSDWYFPDGGFVIEGYEMLKGLAGVTTHESSAWIEIFENTQDIRALAEQVKRGLRRPEGLLEHGFLIRRHGLYTWGRDLGEARRHVEVLEFLFEVVGRQLILSGALPAAAVSV